MENFINSANSSSDFEFKFFPAKEFERIMKQVERDRKPKNTRIWGNFCTISSGMDDDVMELTGDSKRQSEVPKALSDDEIQSIIQSIRDDSKLERRHIPSDSAPFFGPARKLDVEALRNEQMKSKSSSGSSSTMSIHIVDEGVLNVARTAADDKIQVPNQIDVGAGASDCSSLDDASSLQDELMKLCSEIENANGKKASSDDYSSTVDLTYQEERHLRNAIDKTEKKVVCETYNKFIDKKFDFLYEECKNSFDDDNVDDYGRAASSSVSAAQTVVELKQMKQVKEASNDSNVWNPKLAHQIKKNGGPEKRNDDVFPCDVITRKARDVGRAKPDTNEKSQVDARAQRNKADEKVSLPEADIAIALAKITQYQEKICQYLDYLREVIEDPPEIDDVSDLRKRQQRANEFASRFARNHLYQIGRVAEEVRLMPDNPSNVATKVNSLFHVIMQAVQSYLKNVEMFIYNKNPDKLLVLIDFVITSMKICLDRMVFDKRDSMVQRIMRKCSDIKDFLQLHQQSFTKFSSIREQRKKALSSRTMFDYEVPYGKKLSMYENQPKTKRSSHRRAPPSKSPYDAPKYVDSSSNLRPKAPSSRNSVKSSGRVQPLRKSSSNISTMVQRVGSKDSTVTIKTIPEKPLEVKPIEKPDSEFLEMFQNVAKEKVQELLAPILSQLMVKMNLSQSSEMELPTEERPKSPRVMSSVKPKDSLISLSMKPQSPLVEDQDEVEKPKEVVKPKIREKIQRVSQNVQYTYVNSDYGEGEVKVAPSKHQIIPKIPLKPDLQRAESKMKILTSKQKPPMPSHKQQMDPQFMKKFKEQALKERLNYVQQMMENPLYVNEAYDEPWKLFAEISDKLLEEMLSTVLAELDFGEKTFVESFLRHELDC